VTSSSSSGQNPDYHLAWLKRPTNTGYLISIADTSSRDSALNRQLLMSIGIFVGALAVLFVIAWFLSSWMLEPVKDAWERQRRFISDASHELKTPLSVIIANTGILQRDHDIPRQSMRWIDSTADEAGTMKSLVEELLVLARTDEAASGTAQSALAREDLDLSELVDESVLEFDAIAFERGCSIDTDIEKGIRFSADKDQLGRAVRTLVDNASKYATKGTTVMVTLGHAGKRAKLTVNNAGPRHQSRGPRASLRPLLSFGQGPCEGDRRLRTRPRHLQGHHRGARGRDFGLEHRKGRDDLYRTPIIGTWSPSHIRPKRPALPTWEGPAIGLLDLDAFFASVEQLDHPEWRGRPLIVGGSPERRGVVSTASYEARRYGVHSAMPSSQARRLCPDAVWTQGHFGRYREMSERVMAVLDAETPLVEQVSIDEAFFDVTPGRYSHESPIGICRRVQAAVAGLGVTCSIGIGVNKTVAKIASEREKPRGLTVVYPGTEQGFLARCPQA